jgi:hypothetical protein
MSHAASKRYGQVCRYARQTVVLAWSVASGRNWQCQNP